VTTHIRQDSLAPWLGWSGLEGRSENSHPTGEATPLYHDAASPIDG
jgi:hypothetical protein